MVRGSDASGMLGTSTSAQDNAAIQPVDVRHLAEPGFCFKHADVIPTWGVQKRYITKCLFGGASMVVPT
jgi:hypothetical protein